MHGGNHVGLLILAVETALSSVRKCARHVLLIRIARLIGTVKRTVAEIRVHAILSKLDGSFILPNHFLGMAVGIAQVGPVVMPRRYRIPPCFSKCPGARNSTHLDYIPYSEAVIPNARDCGYSSPQ